MVCGLFEVRAGDPSRVEGVAEAGYGSGGKGMNLNFEMGQGTKGSPPHYHAELLTPETYAIYWPSIDEQLNNVPHIWAPYFTKEFLRCAVLNRECFVWGVGTESELRLIVYGRIIEFPATRILQIFLALGNDLDNCLPTLTGALEKLANTTECEYCEIIGRIGWERKLSNFERVAVVLRKPLKHFKVQ
jgi:hypothetical protein